MTSGPMISQQCEENPRKTIGPRELDLLRLKTVSLISAIEGIATKIVFFSSETAGPGLLKRASSRTEGEDYIRLEKKEQASFLICSASSMMIPSIDILSILLIELLDLVDRWKNLVFLSPSFNHLILDFCFQWTDSALSQLWREDLLELRANKRDSLRLESYRDWASITCFSASAIFCLSCPKTSYFHVFNLLLRNFNFGPGCTEGNHYKEWPNYPLPKRWKNHGKATTLQI